MANYGIPYMGSKNTIATWVVDHIPACDNLYELFAGGCAVTHAAILSGKFKDIYANDWEETVQLFVNAIKGKYHDESRWISRETFVQNKATDLYIRYCWSFFAKGVSYSYNKQVEPYFEALHYLLFFNDNSKFKDLGLEVPLMEFDTIEERYTAWRNFCTKYPSIKKNFESVTNDNVIHRMPTLEHFSRMLRLKALEDIKPYFKEENFHVLQGDYRDVEIKEDSICYLDPPYEDTSGYVSGAFNSKEFYQYIHESLVPKTKLVIVSSYEVSDPDLVCIARIKKMQNMKTIHSELTTEDRFRDECLYIPREQVDWYKKNCIIDWTGDL